MQNFLNKRRRRKLYDQWVNSSGLPPEEIPPDLKEALPTADTPGEEYDEPEEDYTPGAPYRRSGYISVPWRQVVYVVLIILVLVIVTAILSTVLIMQSC